MLSGNSLVNPCTPQSLIVGYVTPARPPTARSLVVGKSKCAFQASARSQRVLNNIFFVTEIATVDFNWFSLGAEAVSLRTAFHLLVRPTFPESGD